jgi:hypothetical protein
MHCARRWESVMSDDEILQLASDTSGAHSFDHAHVIRFARAVIDKATSAERDVMRQALEALEYINTHCFIAADHEGPLERAISALRAALAAGALDRLAQANRELGLGERA